MRLGDLTARYVVRRPGDEAVAGRTLIVEVDAEGRPRAVRGAGAAEPHPVPETTRLADLRRDAALRLRILRRAVVVVLVDGQGVLRSVVDPVRLEAALMRPVRGDSEVYGRDDRRAEDSLIRCTHCGRTDRYEDVEPGETPCVHCGVVLRPA